MTGHSGRHSGTPGGCRALGRTCPSRDKAVSGEAGPFHLVPWVGTHSLSPGSLGWYVVPVRGGWWPVCGGLSPTAEPSAPLPLTLVFSSGCSTDLGLNPFLFPPREERVWAPCDLALSSRGPSGRAPCASGHPGWSEERAEVEITQAALPRAGLV